MRTLRCFEWNSRQTLRAILRRRRTGWWVFLEAVDLFHQDEDHERNNDEVKHGLEKHPVVDRGCPGSLGGCE